MRDRYPVSAVVLAAGTSSRMGAENKLLLPWGDKSVLEVVVNTLVGAALHEVVVVVGHEAETVAAVLESYPVRVATNDDFAAGMSASLRTGIEAADAAAAGYLVALGDMPAITAGIVDLLCRRFNEAGESAILLPVNEGRRGHPVIFASDYREELLALSGDRGARSVVERHPGCVVEVPVSASGILADVGTPEEYRNLRERSQ